MKHRLKRILLYVVLGGFVVFFVSFCYSMFVIYSDVKTICIEAKQEFGDDCVNSLIAFFNSDSHTKKEKDHAIWALGQLADEAALPFLLTLDKNLNCAVKRKYESVRCYEVYKAIKWCSKGNATSWMYRNKERWS